MRLDVLSPLGGQRTDTFGDSINPNGIKMKEGVHPTYHDVVFLDQQTGNQFITRSTLTSRDSIEIDGKKLPLFKCEVTSESHPFYTGAQTRIVEAGRVERFRARFARTSGTRAKTSA